jgi:hypothetical protein
VAGKANDKLMDAAAYEKFVAEEEASH